MSGILTDKVHPALAEIRERISGCSEPILDAQVYLLDAASLPFSLGYVRNIVELPDGGQVGGFLDVPISAVVGLGRQLMHEGDTWRDIVNLRLHGRGWRDGVLEHLDGEFRDGRFPASDSKERLELYCLGGAVTCSTGNQRLSAAIGWIAATRPRDPVLRKAFVTVRAVRQDLISKLVGLHRDGALLELAPFTVQARNHYALRTTQGRSVKTYVIHGSELERRTVEGGLFGMRKLPLGHGEDWDWRTIPASVLEAWADADWLEQQNKDLAPRPNPCW